MGFNLKNNAISSIILTSISTILLFTESAIAVSFRRDIFIEIDSGFLQGQSIEGYFIYELDESSPSGRYSPRS